MSIRRLNDAATQLRECLNGLLGDPALASKIQLGERIDLQITRGQLDFVITTKVFSPKRTPLAFGPLMQADKATIRTARLAYRREVELMLKHKRVSSAMALKAYALIGDHLVYRIHEREINARFRLLGLPYRVRRADPKISHYDDRVRWSIFRIQPINDTSTTR
jgi:hypothetical protein